MKPGGFNIIWPWEERPSFIPCLLCGEMAEIRKDKNKKPYFICDECGVQAFIRRKLGIHRLGKLVGENEKDRAVGLKIMNLTHHLLDLQREREKIQAQKGILDLISPNPFWEEAENKITAEMENIQKKIAEIQMDKSEKNHDK